MSDAFDLNDLVILLFASSIMGLALFAFKYVHDKIILSQDKAASVLTFCDLEKES